MSRFANLSADDRRVALDADVAAYLAANRVHVCPPGRESRLVRNMVAGLVGGTETVANRGRRYVWAREQANLRAS